jgi:hypothetical protein
MMIAPNVVDMAIELPLTFETGFTNLQFVALAADALGAGDVNFANMISSIQTDEARHSQQGGPTLEILVEHDPVRAQWVIDKSFWGSARAFAALTGPAMDYYTLKGANSRLFGGWGLLKYHVPAAGEVVAYDRRVERGARRRSSRPTA